MMKLEKANKKDKIPMIQMSPAVRQGAEHAERQLERQLLSKLRGRIVY
jgi:hypothetical protein